MQLSNFTEPELAEFTWKLKDNPSPEKLDIQITFLTPLELSQGQEADYLSFKLVNTSYFYGL